MAEPSRKAVTRAMKEWVKIEKSKCMQPSCCYGLVQAYV